MRPAAQREGGEKNEKMGKRNPALKKEKPRLRGPGCMISNVGGGKKKNAGKGRTPYDCKPKHVSTPTALYRRPEGAKRKKTKPDCASPGGDPTVGLSG